MSKPLELTSSQFQNGMPIPVAYTGEGEDRSPPLHWENLPPGTRSLALIVEDPDAPDPAHPQRTFCHWVLYNLPPNSQSLPDGATLEVMPPGVKLGLNDFQRQDYGGPMPPVGSHRYFFRLYALDTVLPDLGRPSRAELREAMDGHILGEAQLMGTYQKMHHRRSH